MSTCFLIAAAGVQANIATETLTGKGIVFTENSEGQEVMTLDGETVHVDRNCNEGNGIVGFTSFGGDSAPFIETLNDLGFEAWSEHMDEYFEISES